MPLPAVSHARPDDYPFDGIHLLRNEIASLRDAIDELREVIEWGNRNRRDYNPLLFQFRRSSDESAATEPIVLSSPDDKPLDDEPPLDDCHDDTPRRQETLW